MVLDELEFVGCPVEALYQAKREQADNTGRGKGKITTQ
jgi:hypothetical protein